MLRTPLDHDAPANRHRQASDAEDVRLIGRVAERDLVAFERLYRCYRPRLRRFLERMSARPAVVDEVVNDTLLVVWNRAAAFNHTSKVSTWVFAIAYRKVLKALSRETAPAEEPDEDIAADGSGPEQSTAGAETRNALLQAMQDLSAEHRAVLNLTYYHGMGYREIAAIVDCPVDTVKTRMFHARRRLRAILSGTLGDWL